MFLEAIDPSGAAGLARRELAADPLAHSRASRRHEGADPGGALGSALGSKPVPTGVVTNPVTTIRGLLQAQWLPVVAVKVDQAPLVPAAGIPRRTGGSSAGGAGNGEQAVPPKRSAAPTATGNRRRTVPSERAAAVPSRISRPSTRRTRQRAVFRSGCRPAATRSAWHGGAPARTVRRHDLNRTEHGSAAPTAARRGGSSRPARNPRFTAELPGHPGDD